MVDLFKKYGAQYNVDYLLMAAQGYQESTLDQGVKSPVGAIGVMQVMPPTGKELNVGDITKVDSNIHAGVKYMRFMMDQYYKDEPMDNLNKALMTFASYNAGPGRIRQLRRETEKRGLDPNVWFGNVERVASERIGRETVTYVEQHLQVLRRLPSVNRSTGTARSGKGRGREAQLNTLTGRSITRHPGHEQGIADGKHHGTDEDADQAKRKQTADHAGAHQQQRQVRAFGHQDRAHDVVERDDHQRPEQQCGRCPGGTLPVEPPHGGKEHGRRAELRDTQDEGHDSEQRRKGHAGDRQADAGERGLHDRRDDHAERDAPDGLRGEPDNTVARLAARCRPNRSSPSAALSPFAYMTAAMASVSRNCTSSQPRLCSVPATQRDGRRGVWRRRPTRRRAQDWRRSCSTPPPPASRRWAACRATRAAAAW